MADRTSEILDAIDELVDEQMANYGSRSGYDHNVNQVECRICGEDSHSLAVTQRMREMRSKFRETIDYYEGNSGVDQSVVDELNAYSYAEDDSPIYCPGGDFIGPWAMPAQLRSMRYEAERRRLEDEREQELNELLSDDPSHEQLREAVRQGVLAGPLNWIGHYLAGLPLPDITRDDDSPWSVVRVRSPWRQGWPSVAGGLLEQINAYANPFQQYAPFRRMESAAIWAAMGFTPPTELPPEVQFPLRSGGYRYGEYFATPQPMPEPRWWRCEDVRPLNPLMQERSDEREFGMFGRRVIVDRRIFLIIGRDEVELLRSPEGNYSRYGNPGDGTVPQWMEIFASRPPMAGEWDEIVAPLAEWEQGLLASAQGGTPPDVGLLQSRAGFNADIMIHDETAETPQQRALPRPSTTPRGWVGDPSRQRGSFHGRRGRRRNG